MLRVRPEGVDILGVVDIHEVALQKHWSSAQHLYRLVDIVEELE
jgi:hypothetical protein